ncbi:MAG: hypothetical protein KatS3mg087_1057 [Patescibacteria group bacterium]|nr:MAG: hypothetical protein KatS3mg087_1057 [Patescibacteria group bacterium]
MGTTKALSLPSKIKAELPAIISEHLSSGAIDPNRIVAGVLHLVINSPMLRECEWDSLVSSIVRSVRAGLDCTGTWGEGWIIPYRDKKSNRVMAEFVPGYRGLIKLALHGNCNMIEARLVYEQDEFAIDYGSPNVLTHRPCLSPDRGAVIGAYALAWIKGTSRPLIEYMTVDEINAIATRSKAYKVGPWQTDWGEMARKTVVRRLVKYLDLSSAAKEIIERADRVEFDFDDRVDFDPPSKAPQRLKNASEAIKEFMRSEAIQSPAEGFVESPEVAAEAQQDSENAVDSAAESKSSEVFSSYEKLLLSAKRDELPHIVQRIMADNRLDNTEREMLRGYARQLWSANS